MFPYLKYFTHIIFALAAAYLLTWALMEFTLPAPDPITMLKTIWDALVEIVQQIIALI